MTAFHGKQGTGTWLATGITFEISSFTVNATADVADVSIMDVTTPAAGTHWKKSVAGFKDWTATCECVEPVLGGGIGELGEESTLTLDTEAGLAYSGSAICTGFSVTNDKDDAGRLSLTFQGSGQLSAG